MRDFREKFKDLRCALLDTVFPPLCVHCGGLVEGGGLRYVCSDCEKKITLVQGPHCKTCGYPFPGAVDENTMRVCPHCKELNPSYREGRTVLLFKEVARSLVHALKYEQRLHVLEDMRRLAERNTDLMDWIRGKTLIPVPLHTRKKRERGYNQAELWAMELAKAAGGDTNVKQLLIRKRDTPSQTLLDRRERIRNLQNAFALVRRAVINPDHNYLLVDDVFTTGSTLNSCAKVLRKAGALALDVVTFGHG